MRDYKQMSGANAAKGMSASKSPLEGAKASGPVSGSGSGGVGVVAQAASGGVGGPGNGGSSSVATPYGSGQGGVAAQGGVGGSGGGARVGGVLPIIKFKTKARPEEKKETGGGRLDEGLFKVQISGNKMVVTGAFTKNGDVGRRLGVAGFIKAEKSEQGFVAAVDSFIRKARQYPSLMTKTEAEMLSQEFVEEYILAMDDDEFSVYGMASPAMDGVEDSPKKRVRVRDIPAREALDDWTIRVGPGRKLVAVSNVGYDHRGILQYALGDVAREEKAGFEFDRGSKTWTVSSKNVVKALEGITEEDIDEAFIRALLLRSIEDGNEGRAEG